MADFSDWQLQIIRVAGRVAGSDLDRTRESSSGRKVTEPHTVQNIKNTLRPFFALLSPLPRQPPSPPYIHTSRHEHGDTILRAHAANLYSIYTKKSSKQVYTVHTKVYTLHSHILNPIHTSRESRERISKSHTYCIFTVPSHLHLRLSGARVTAALGIIALGIIPTLVSNSAVLLSLIPLGIIIPVWANGKWHHSYIHYLLTAPRPAMLESPPACHVSRPFSVSSLISAALSFLHQCLVSRTCIQ